MITIFGASDVGRRRSCNEDCFNIINLADGSICAVVCDGMGGANGGNIASTLARDTITAQISASYNEKMSDRSIKAMLESAVAAANITVFDKAVSDSTLSGMGTTAVVALIRSDTLYIVHVGDSRAYLINGTHDSIEQLTTDHSIVQMMVESGQITEAEARIHPKRNIITRAIGVSDSVTPDFNILRLNGGDKLLICSDGLTNFMQNKAITDIVSGNTPENAVKLLIDGANDAGGGDNITAVVAEYAEE
ncbi:MAG: Stp1/IreP family PP2C-type Ser/Thr phosphatase [Acutalibacteraceae bacterium]